ncbi:MAG: glycosyltransferase family 2 protein [Bacteroidaceae bacterium]|nr:glycosyltransferase family 2 protein [Bacteroidaceae bacterium]
MIGVIVPVYKVEKYIIECIESILTQTYTNFRLILVDDGTPDNAGKICDEYAEKDQRITVIHQENAGVTRARARGVEEASDCEFITFVDSDDTIEADCLQTFIGCMDSKTDIVISHIDDNFAPQGDSVDIKEFVKMLMLDKSMCLAVWGKLYRKELLTEYVFDIPRNITFSEDIIMNLRIVFGGRPKIKLAGKSIYNYRANTDGVAKNFRTSIEYEQELHQLKINAVPYESRKEYIPYTITRRLLGWKNVWGYKYNVKGMCETAFYKELKRDMAEYGFKLPLIDRIIFSHTNQIIRFAAINTKKILNILRSWS